MMHNTIFAAVTAISLASTIPAFAGEGNNLAATERPAQGAVVASPLRRDTGSAAYPAFAEAPPVQVIAGGVLPSIGGSEAPVQTANSLPPGSLDGTPAYEVAQSVQRYLAARSAAISRFASAR